MPKLHNQIFKKNEFYSNSETYNNPSTCRISESTDSILFQVIIGLQYHLNFSHKREIFISNRSWLKFWNKPKFKIRRSFLAMAKVSKKSYSTQNKQKK